MFSSTTNKPEENCPYQSILIGCGPSMEMMRMAFDLAEFDILALSEQGTPMALIHPHTRLPMIDDDKTPLTISLMGRNSDAFRNTMREIQAARAERQARGTAPDPELREQEDILLLVACTTDWTLKILDGKPFPCTPPNIRKLWNDPRFRPLREAGLTHVMNDANFFRKSSTISDDTPDLNSSYQDLSLKVVAPSG
jgi:hypothetical protein